MKSICKNDSVDSAISDLHAWRRELSEQFGGNIHKIVEDAMRRQEQSGHRIIRHQESMNERHSEPHGSVPGTEPNNPSTR